MDDYWLGSDLLGAEDACDDVFGDLVGASTISVQDVTPPTVTRSPYLGPAPVQPLVDGPLYGPGSSSGTVYTDKATITAVQKKLKALGYYHGEVDGKYGPLTNQAIRNYSGKDGPPDDALLTKLGLRKEISFTDDEVDAMKVQVASASSPAQVQIVAAKVEKLAATASPEVQSQAQTVKRSASSAVTQQDVEFAKQQMVRLLDQMERERRLKIGLIAGGVAVGVATLLGIVALVTRRK